MELKPCSGVLDTITEFQNCPELKYLTGGEWKMFGIAKDVSYGIGLLDLLIMKRCNKYCEPECDKHVLSKTEARKLIAGNSIRRTDVGNGYFVLTNKSGNRTFGFFREY